ncbi:CinA family protein [Ornithinimicrobium pekingense]|uniref:Competence damage-inducible protein A n=1 Tax=Ornithinimicrobium pekingense TaxID=384677 RepID=A0ABQ2F9K3_9MICO|nr:nicotinamide-nucleotide amidohydrolase family protein [Ornithinimicrobium pekingense]GGK64576.1 competence damage-inducible protein A [Ornithinimicrobium pekingense]
MTEDPASRVVHLLRARGESVAAAESLTGGLVCAALTDVPGASAVVRGGVVAYAAEVKRDVLRVPPELLARHGTVSAECAAAMAEGVRSLTCAGWGVATTGVAGPDPSEGHPVGTVHVAVAGEHGTTTRALHLCGSRTGVRLATVAGALALLEESVAASGGAGGTVGHPDPAACRDTDTDEG